MTKSPAIDTDELAFLTSFSRPELTTVYNVILERDNKLIGQKSDALSAIKEHLDRTKTTLADYVKSLPKDLAAVFKANGIANQNKKIKEPKAPKSPKPPKAAKEKPVTAVKAPIVQTKVESPAQAFNTPMGAGRFIRDLITGTAKPGETVNGLLDPALIIKEVEARFVMSKTGPSDVAFNKTLLREKGYIVPIFRTPRVKKN